MKIHFYSFTDGKKSTSFVEEATFDGKCYEFLDHSQTGTKIRIILGINQITIKRIGSIDSEIVVKEGILTKAYHNSGDLKFEFMVKGHDIKINDNSISFSYDYYYQNDYIGKIKIGLLIKA